MEPLIKSGAERFAKGVLWTKNTMNSNHLAMPCSKTSRTLPKHNVSNLKPFNSKGVPSGQANYQVAKAWQIRENFSEGMPLAKDLFAANASEALHLFYRWTKNALNKQIKEVSKVVAPKVQRTPWEDPFGKMFKNHTSGVVEALIHSLSNAMAAPKGSLWEKIKWKNTGNQTGSKRIQNLPKLQKCYPLLPRQP